MAEISAQQAQELLSGATSGPWTADETDPARTVGGEWYACEINAPVERTSMGGRGTVVVAMQVGKPDRDLIVAAPDLAETVITLTERLEKAQAQLTKWRGDGGALTEQIRRVREIAEQDCSPRVHDQIRGVLRSDRVTQAVTTPTVSPFADDPRPPEVVL